MTTALFLIFALPILMVAVFLFWRRQILGNRALRVLAGLFLVPLVLFCGFGFLASFEGADASFIAFRIGYAAAGSLLAIGAGVLMIGKPRKAPPSSI